MRSNLGFAAIAVVGIAGCVHLAPEPRGATMKEYAGGVPVVFTNASSETMCGFFMSYDKEDEHGDNWLPVAGLASGKSIEFHVKAGRYKARWDTCKTTKTKPYFAATLWRDMSVAVERQTQLYAYVADRVAPTKFAATLGRDYKVVRFQGQPIDLNPRPQPNAQHVALRAQTEDSTPKYGFIGRVLVPYEEPVPVFEKFDAREYIDPKVVIKKQIVRPSLSRKFDVAESTINYRKR